MLRQHPAKYAMICIRGEFSKKFYIPRNQLVLKYIVAISGIPVVAIYLAVSKVWHESPFQPTDLPLLLELPGSQLVFCVFENVLRNQSVANVGDTDAHCRCLCLGSQISDYQQQKIVKVRIIT